MLAATYAPARWPFFLVMNRHDTETQLCIDRMLAGDETYRHVLIGHAYERLRLLARKLLGGYPGIRRWEQTDDVLQNASTRLWKSLKDVAPKDVREFFALAATQIRRELIDLSRHYYGPQGIGANYATDDHTGREPSPGNEKPDPTDDPATLTEWTELHERVRELPEEQRETFDLLYYHGLSQPEAAEVLGISLRTLKRRWRDTRRSVFAAYHGTRPGMS